MTRIGFAYNQKPESSEGHSAEEADLSRPEEPPSKRRDRESRTFDSPPAEHDASARRLAAIAAGDDRYAEWDSVETLDAVAGALSAFGTVVRLEASADFPERLREEAPDIVFNIAEGLRGPNREAHVPAICEFFDIPYSGSDPFTLSLCLDKARTKEILDHHRVPTAPFLLIENADDLHRLIHGEAALATPSELTPLFVKPVHEGSSKGITERNLVRSPLELEEQVIALLQSYEQPVLVEEYLPGPEYTCGIIGNGAGARLLPIVGLNFRALPSGAVPIYGFEAKWLWDRPDEPLEIFQCPASTTPALRDAIERVVLRAYRVLGCRDWSRIDVRLDADGVPNVVEVNPLPGILPDPADNSCLPKAARVAGMSYDELIQSCLIFAAERGGVHLDRSLRLVKSEAAA